MSGRDVGDQVAALLHAIADRHDTGGCGCTDPHMVRDLDPNGPDRGCYPCEACDA